jgi:Zn-dependent membrane protease YugP
MMLFILITVVTMGISLFAAARVKSNFAKFSKVPNARGMSGAEAATFMLRRAGVEGVEIVSAGGLLGDHYDPMHKRLVLSPENFEGRSIAALGIACHEAGHAIQHANAYAPLKARMAAVGVTNYASSAVMWLPLIGMFTGLFHGTVGFTLMAAGWGVIMLFNLVTLPVEFDATRRAKVALTETGMISSDEKVGVDKVLDAAALTYVAAFITSLAYMLYYLLPLLMGNRD